MGRNGKKRVVPLTEEPLYVPLMQLLEGFEEAEKKRIASLLTTPPRLTKRRHQKENRK